MLKLMIIHLTFHNRSKSKKDLNFFALYVANSSLCFPLTIHVLKLVSFTLGEFYISMHQAIYTFKKQAKA